MKNAQAKTDFPVNIGNPARNALQVAGFSKLKQLTELTEAELNKLHGMGPEGGSKGGTIMFEGTPKELAGVKQSLTSAYLRN